MPVFERSWQTRLVRGRSILPQIRDQGINPTCAYHCAAGGVESANKKAFAEMDRDFEKVVSVDYLIFKVPNSLMEDILGLIKSEGALTQDDFDHHLRTGLDDIVHHVNDNHQRVKIEDFISLTPQLLEGDFVDLMTHVLLGGTAIGIFPTTTSYTDETVYFEDVGEPLLSDPDDWYPYEVIDDEEEEEYEVEAEAEAEDKKKTLYHAVLLISLGMDEECNLYWRVLDSHSSDAGEAGTRKIAVNLIKEAYIVVAAA